MNKDFGNEADTLKTGQNSYLHEGDVRRSSNPRQSTASSSSVGGGRGVYSIIDGDVPGSMRTVGADPGKSKPLLSTADGDFHCIHKNYEQSPKNNEDPARLETKLVTITWNACGMEEGAINDAVALLDNAIRWDVVMLQEGPFTEKEFGKILDGGHVSYASRCVDTKRSVGILIHRRWQQRGAKFVFKSASSQLIFVDMDLGELRLRLISAHLPHNEYTDQAYEAALLGLEEVIESSRRAHRQNIVGTDANAVIGARHLSDNQRIIGEYGHGNRDARGHLFVQRLHGMNLAALSTHVSTTWERAWTHEYWSTKVKRQIDYVLTDEVKGDSIVGSGIVEELGGKSDHRAAYAELKLGGRPADRGRRARAQVGWKPRLDEAGLPSAFHRLMDEAVSIFSEGGGDITSLVVEAAVKSGGASSSSRPKL